MNDESYGQVIITLIVISILIFLVAHFAEDIDGVRANAVQFISVDQTVVGYEINVKGE